MSNCQGTAPSSKWVVRQVGVPMVSDSPTLRAPATVEVTAGVRPGACSISGSPGVGTFWRPQHKPPTGAGANNWWINGLRTCCTDVRSKRQASLRELETKMVRKKTAQTMHLFDLRFYPAPQLSLLSPHLTETAHYWRRYVCNRLGCPPLSFCKQLSISTVDKEGTFGIASASSSFFLQGARQHA